MYINENGWMPFRPVSGSNEQVQMTEASQDAEPAAGGSDPGYAPISPDTPSWGPPPGDDNSPGYAPISPDLQFLFIFYRVYTDFPLFSSRQVDVSHLP